MRYFAAVLAIVFCAVPIALAQDAKKDLEMLQGDWKRIKMEAGGKEDVAGDNLVVRIQGDKLMVVNNGEVAKTGDIRLKLDPSVDPKLMELTLPDGQVMEGIYKIEKNRWTVCVRTDTSVKNRPVSFETKGEATLILVVLEKKE